jgi:ABC-2 type transport system permease protein
MRSIRNSCIIFKRELKAYFESPVAYVFMIVFLMLMAFLTFMVSRFYENGVAELEPFFFVWHPWVFLLLVPAATMGLWSEERSNGTIELLLTMPVTLGQAVAGKFLAAWLFLCIGIALTFPVVATTCYLGSPDMGVVFSGYLGSLLMAGAYASVGMLTSAMTRSQVIGFVLALASCLLLLIAGWEPVTGLFVNWAPNWLVEGVAAFSLMPHYQALQRGIIDAADFVYYAGVMIFMLCATALVLDNRKSA